MNAFFYTIKKSTDSDESRYIFSKNNVNDSYLRPLTNHDKDILTNHGKILTNMTLTVVKSDRFTPDGKWHYYPLIILM